MCLYAHQIHRTHNIHTHNVRKQSVEWNPEWDYHYLNQNCITPVTSAVKHNILQTEYANTQYMYVCGSMEGSSIIVRIIIIEHVCNGVCFECVRICVAHVRVYVYVHILQNTNDTRADTIISSRGKHRVTAREEGLYELHVRMYQRMCQRFIDFVRASFLIWKHTRVHKIRSHVSYVRSLPHELPRSAGRISWIRCSHNVSIQLKRKRSWRIQPRIHNVLVPNPTADTFNVYTVVLYPCVIPLFREREREYIKCLQITPILWRTQRVHHLIYTRPTICRL